MQKYQESWHRLKISIASKANEHFPGVYKTRVKTAAGQRNRLWRQQRSLRVCLMPGEVKGNDLALTGALHAALVHGFRQIPFLDFLDADAVAVGTAPDVGHFHKTDELSILGIAIAAERSLFYAAGHQPVTGAVKKQVFGDEQNVFILLNLVFEVAVLIGERDVPRLQFHKQVLGLIGLAVDE